MLYLRLFLVVIGIFLPIAGVIFITILSQNLLKGFAVLIVSAPMIILSFYLGKSILREIRSKFKG